MKKLKILAVAFAIAMTFTACSNKNNNNYSSNYNSNTSHGGVISSIVSDGGQVVSGVESGVERMLPGSREEDRRINSAHNSAEIEGASDDASPDADIGANAGADIQKPDLSFLSSYSNEKHGWGQGTEVDEKKRPVSCLQFQERYGELDAYFIKSQDAGQIYLTFDEGYENGYTGGILDTLKEKKCPAVFFVTMPYVRENPDLVRRMIDEGHIVGNHTVNHPSMPGVSADRGAEEIMELHRYVSEQFGYEMTLFRPPMGEWSERTLALTQDLGYKSIFWSFAYKDWETDNQPEPAAALEKISAAAHPGAIYLLHAVSSTNTEILGAFIDNVRAQGYEFAAMES